MRGRTFQTCRDDRSVSVEIDDAAQYLRQVTRKIRKRPPWPGLVMSLSLPLPDFNEGGGVGRQQLHFRAEPMASQPPKRNYGQYPSETFETPSAGRPRPGDGIVIRRSARSASAAVPAASAKFRHQHGQSTVIVRIIRPPEFSMACFFA